MGVADTTLPRAGPLRGRGLRRHPGGVIPRARSRLRLLALATVAGLHVLAPRAWSDTLWVESSSSEDFPELRLRAIPLNRTTWRMLGERKVRVEIDGRPALLLAAREVEAAPALYLLLDRSDPALAAAGPLGKLWEDLLGALPPGATVRAYLLAAEARRLTPEPAQPEAVREALRRVPHGGRAAPLRRGLELVLEDLREDDPTRPLVVLFSMTTDPTLAGTALRRALRADLEDAGAPVVALSLGSDADRSLLRDLGEDRGGLTVHSWGVPNLRSALGRLAVGLKLAHDLTVQSPIFERDGSLRRVEIFRTRDERVLTETRLRMPGDPPPLPAPTRAPPAPPPLPPPVTPPDTPASPSNPWARVAAPPRLALGDWPTSYTDEAEKDTAGLASSQLRLLASHARAGLARTRRTLELALESRDRTLAEAMYRRARVSLAFLGSTYGKVTSRIDQLLDAHAQRPGARGAFLSAQRARLRELRASWSTYKDALSAWEAELAALPR